MAIVKWGIDHPNNPRNKENPGRSQQLNNFVGTATKGAIRTNPDGTIMGSKSEVKQSVPISLSVRTLLIQNV